jgi:very-short-patch-repair endonuclease
MPRKMTQEEFINRSKEIHGDVFTYAKVKYIRSSDKVIITCRIHGDFIVIPNRHLCYKRGCPYCSGHNKTTSQFIAESKSIHGDSFTYEKTEYTTQNNKVIVTCKEHGDISVRPDGHLRGSKCPYCAKCGKRTKQDFIDAAKEMHGDEYCYSKCVYTNRRTPVTVICSDHGPFSVMPTAHKKGQGCPRCRASRGEKRIMRELTKRNISYEFQAKFKTCKTNRTLPFDFLLPESRLLIEYDGIQHHKPMKIFGGSDRFERTQYIDNFKTEWSNENGYTLVRIPYWDYDRIPEIIEDIVSKIILTPS